RRNPRCATTSYVAAGETPRSTVSARWPDDLAESVGVGRTRLPCIAGADPPARSRSGTAPRVPDAALSSAIPFVADETATHARSAAARRSTGDSDVGGDR